MDNAYKAYSKVKKNLITNSVFKKAMTQVGEQDKRINKLDYLLLAKQVDALSSQISEIGIDAE